MKHLILSNQNFGTRKRHNFLIHLPLRLSSLFHSIHPFLQKALICLRYHRIILPHLRIDLRIQLLSILLLSIRLNLDFWKSHYTEFGIKVELEKTSIGVSLLLLILSTATSIWPIIQSCVWLREHHSHLLHPLPHLLLDSAAVWVPKGSRLHRWTGATHLHYGWSLCRARKRRGTHYCSE